MKFKIRPCLADLPVKIYSDYLFPCLNLVDLLNLSLMNQRFKAQVESWLVINELYFSTILDVHDHWFGTHSPIAFDIQLEIKWLSILERPFTHMKQLQHLRIEDSTNLLKVNHLNYFTDLEILELRRFTFKADEADNYLDLPFLRSLWLQGSIMADDYGLGIISPILSNLYMNIPGRLQKKIQFGYPFSIEKLRVYSINYELFYYTQFQQLDCLEFSDIRLEDIDRLHDFSFLSEIKVENIFFDEEKLRQLGIHAWFLEMDDRPLSIVLNGQVLIPRKKEQ